MKKENIVITESSSRKSAKRGRKPKGARQYPEIVTERCCKWLSTLGISPITVQRTSFACLSCVDLCRTSSESEEKRKSGQLLIRLVSDGSTATSRNGYKRCLKVLVFMPAKASQLEELWQALKSRTSCSQSAWNLSLALPTPTPVEG